MTSTELENCVSMRSLTCPALLSTPRIWKVPSKHKSGNGLSDCSTCGVESARQHQHDQTRIQKKTPAVNGWQINTVEHFRNSDGVRTRKNKDQLPVVDLRPFTDGEWRRSRSFFVDDPSKQDGLLMSSRTSLTHPDQTDTVPFKIAESLQEEMAIPPMRCCDSKKKVNRIQTLPVNNASFRKNHSQEELVKNRENIVLHGQKINGQCSSQSDIYRKPWELYKQKRQKTNLDQPVGIEARENSGGSAKVNDLDRNIYDVFDRAMTIDSIRVTPTELYGRQNGGLSKAGSGKRSENDLHSAPVHLGVANSLDVLSRDKMASTGFENKLMEHLKFTIGELRQTQKSRVRKLVHVGKYASFTNETEKMEHTERKSFDLSPNMRKCDPLPEVPTSQRKATGYICPSPSQELLVRNSISYSSLTDRSQSSEKDSDESRKLGMNSKMQKNGHPCKIEFKKETLTQDVNFLIRNESEDQMKIGGIFIRIPGPTEACFSEVGKDSVGFRSTNSEMYSNVDENERSVETDCRDVTRDDNRSSGITGDDIAYPDITSNDTRSPNIYPDPTDVADGISKGSSNSISLQSGEGKNQNHSTHEGLQVDANSDEHGGQLDIIGDPDPDGDMFRANSVLLFSADDKFDHFNIYDDNDDDEDI